MNEHTKVVVCSICVIVALVTDGCCFGLCRLKMPVESALKDAQLSIKNIDEVVLVGGSTRIPAVLDVVKKMTGKEPNCTVNPDEVVALGAAVQVTNISLCMIQDSLEVFLYYNWYSP